MSVVVFALQQVLYVANALSVEKNQKKIKKMEVTILSRELNEESAKKFYEVTENMLEQLAHSQGIDDLSEYYELTDFKIGAYGELLKNYGDSISGVFMQMAFHAQNASRLEHNREPSSINLHFLRDKLCDFDPKRFLFEPLLKDASSRV